MIPYSSILTEIALPVFIMLGLERFAVYYFLRTPRQIAWVQRHRWLHPNAISRARYPMGFVSALLLHMGYAHLCFLFFTFWMITDITDGDIARRCDLYTEEGATIDPLSDKLMYAPMLMYLAWQGPLSPLLVGLFLAFDITGQVSRRFITVKSANLFGKAKTFMVVVLLIVVGLEWIYGPLPLLGRSIYPLLAMCTGLAFCSTFFKVIPNYWYANILSILNLVCGLAGCWVVLTGHPPVYALGLVFLGQFLDLFDGRAAERWGSTPQGELFDDVADGTSFGLTVGLIVMVAFSKLWIGLLIGGAYLAAVIYRLIRFVVEKRKEGVLGGVATFSGLPSPAGALMAGTSCVLISNQLANGIIVIITALLMISRVSYPHFGRAVLPRIPKIVKVLVLGGFLFMLALGVRRDQYLAPLLISFVADAIYLISPLFSRASRKAA
ncbi:CDP-diacylglycerol--glycerol-3-phosphate 3-phosphatidyltransferase and CDP-diacylglycerol--serine O-phosphatidyltransferase [Syntrophotalea carbinolica DSM 2380]|uniref:CDP-diacylglycerol--glycerol-3-phosphate 3-phosphatidyltransferase and CDP-diacylglycerol--serine O-phosphatidyltransferase n=1 Tax=Syntrophotalea carbinolica (strain DSM 2380 / NBRC 103641 / GraBd1) TaxID=338963 RepID=Q3A0S0_SYNC1|nr:CDP-alcohol phosphatidyltransferase family protein [Syntrophotalea carbinolica]ABA90037.1 CDP-diacylglycerol--glycerol-3-phosphate 3-phosphatidyltransferase and CDP-diacylglycerol--serine O-phosphatidyltransferase [Syntrophotalea carbinolica DSM 2380]